MGGDQKCPHSGAASRRTDQSRSPAPNNRELQQGDRATSEREDRGAAWRYLHVGADLTGEPRGLLGSNGNPHCLCPRTRALEGTDKIASETEEKSKDTPEPRQGPATDIGAVLTVILRRDDKSHYREREDGWTLDFRGSDLRGARLSGVHLEGANLFDAHLEGANLEEAR